MRNLFYILMFFSISLFAADANTNWDSALKFFEDAESKVRQSKNNEAVVLLNTCVENLKELQYNHPTWNASVVRNRLRAAEKRIGDVEELILASINSLSRIQLINQLKETQIAKAKFSKAMMIIYDQLKTARGKLKYKNKDLDVARRAASNKLIKQSRLDKLTFEILKLKKTLKEKNAKLVNLENVLEKSNKDSGIKAVINNLEEQYAAVLKKEKMLRLERRGFIKDKEKIVGQLKTVSLKYTSLYEKEKSFEKILVAKEAIFKRLKNEFQKESNMRKQYGLSAENLADKLELSLNTIKAQEKNHKALMKNLESLRSQSVNSKMLVDLKNQNEALAKQNNKLKQIEIDLSSKSKAYKAESDKNQRALEEYFNDPERNNSIKLKAEVVTLKGKIAAQGKQTLISNTIAISLKSDISSLREQLRLQKRIIANFKKPKKPEVVQKENTDSNALSKAYAKNEAELQEKLKLSQGRIQRLEAKNRVLKDENISGDDDIIRKYVEVRNELKKYKEKIAKLGKTDVVVTKTIEVIVTEEENKESEKKEKIEEFFFQAIKAEKAKQFQAAIGLYSEILKLERRNFEALLRLGLLHYGRRHFHDAKVHLKKAFYLDPDNAQLLLALGLCELELDNLDLAVSSLSRLVGMYPKDGAARMNLGVSLHSLGWTNAAFGQLEKACELDSKNPEAAFNFAIVCLALPEPQIAKAQENYEKAVKLGIIRDPELDKFFKQYEKN